MCLLYMFYTRWAANKDGADYSHAPSIRYVDVC